MNGNRPSLTVAVLSSVTFHVTECFNLNLGTPFGSAGGPITPERSYLYPADPSARC